MRRAAAIVRAMSALAWLACGGRAVGPVGSEASGRALPSYTGHQRELFDDAIDPRAVGYELERAAVPRSDALLRERTQVGDNVVRARVTTVTSKNEDQGASWQIGFRTIQKLAGHGPAADGFTVELGRKSAAAGIMRAWEARLIGTAFIVFVREFALPGSPAEAELHFHLAADAKEEVAAVQAALATPVR